MRTVVVTVVLALLVFGSLVAWASSQTPIRYIPTQEPINQPATQPVCQVSTDGGQTWHQVIGNECK